VMALWAPNAKKEEASHYYATIEEISAVLPVAIQDYDAKETEAILDFLVLKQEGLLTIKDDPNLAEDLPIWEHNKRLTRFDIRPIIKVGNRYCWGPYSMERSSSIWMGISGKHKMPSDLDASSVAIVLKRGHEDMEVSLAKKAKEIALRYTSKVKSDVYPHKYDGTIQDIGDYDVLAYLEDRNILLNIESKIIDPPYSAKDSGRMQRAIFGKVNKADGAVIKKGYLQKVEVRAEYLKSKWQDLMRGLSWPVPTSGPRVVSIFLTKMGFWWTKNPPISTEVHFIEIRLLDDFIKNI